MDETLRARETHPALLLDICDALRPLAEPAAIKATAMRLLGMQLHVHRVAYFEVVDGHYVVEGAYCDGVPAIADRHPIESFGPALYETYRSGRVVCDADTQANPELSPDERAGFAAIHTRAYIGLPLIKNGEFTAGLAIHSSEPRVWTGEEVDLAREVGARTRAAIERARAESERQRLARLRGQQTRLLELIASAKPLDECLGALCVAVPRIVGAGVRASVLVADEARVSFRQPIAPELHASWVLNLTGALISDFMDPTHGETAFRGQTITCEDVTTDERWSQKWRHLCQANDVLAGYSVPVWNEHGEAVASFMLCFDRRRKPSVWEQELAAFGSRIASIALARNRANEALRTADRRKDEFLATLAHELRNPMAPLRNGLEIIRQNNPETTQKARA